MSPNRGVHQFCLVPPLSPFFSSGLKPPGFCCCDKGSAFGTASKDPSWNRDPLRTETQIDHLAKILDRAHGTPCQAHPDRLAAVEDPGRRERKTPCAATLIRPHKFTIKGTHDKIIACHAGEKGEVRGVQDRADRRRIDQAESENSEHGETKDQNSSEQNAESGALGLRARIPPIHHPLMGSNLFGTISNDKMKFCWIW